MIVSMRRWISCYGTCLFVYLGFYVAFNTVQVISRRVVGRAEEISTYSSSGFCTADQRQATTSFPTYGHDGDRTPAAEVGGESVTTTVPEHVVHNVHKAVTRSCFGVTRQHRASVGKWMLRHCVTTSHGSLRTGAFHPTPITMAYIHL